eukprot:TRINITY_DN671_c0_g1_i8.p1 TRINITY_DN671_c0_g1~~TRINITY_DN671_c0_g1_i8.p1  ORF type:complete len:1042 (-),score=199.02 TRINITY_DN671_c0_g1_i8:2863-5988(-)
MMKKVEDLNNQYPDIVIGGLAKVKSSRISLSPKPNSIAPKKSDLNALRGKLLEFIDDIAKLSFDMKDSKEIEPLLLKYFKHDPVLVEITVSGFNLYCQDGDKQRLYETLSGLVTRYIKVSYDLEHQHHRLLSSMILKERNNLTNGIIAHITDQHFITSFNQEDVSKTQQNIDSLVNTCKIEEFSLENNVLVKYLLDKGGVFINYIISDKPCCFETDQYKSLMRFAFAPSIPTTLISQIRSFLTSLRLVSISYTYNDIYRSFLKINLANKIQQIVDETSSKFNTSQGESDHFSLDFLIQDMDKLGQDQTNDPSNYRRRTPNHQPVYSQKESMEVYIIYKKSLPDGAIQHIRKQFTEARPYHSIISHLTDKEKDCLLDPNLISKVQTDYNSYLQEGFLTQLDVPLLDNHHVDGGSGGIPGGSHYFRTISWTDSHIEAKKFILSELDSRISVEKFLCEYNTEEIGHDAYYILDFLYEKRRKDILDYVTTFKLDSITFKRNDNPRNRSRVFALSINGKKGNVHRAYQKILEDCKKVMSKQIVVTSPSSNTVKCYEKLAVLWSHQLDMKLHIQTKFKIFSLLIISDNHQRCETEYSRLKNGPTTRTLYFTHFATTVAETKLFEDNYATVFPDLTEYKFQVLCLANNVDEVIGLISSTWEVQKYLKLPHSLCVRHYEKRPDIISSITKSASITRGRHDDFLSIRGLLRDIDLTIAELSAIYKKTINIQKKSFGDNPTTNISDLIRLLDIYNVRSPIQDACDVIINSKKTSVLSHKNIIVSVSNLNVLDEISEVAVSSLTSSFGRDTGLAKHLLKGSTLIKDLDEIEKTPNFDVKPGKVYHTTSGGLLFKSILHIIRPNLDDPQHDHYITESMKLILQKAKELKAKSIAIPIVSNLIRSYSPWKIKNILFEPIFKWLEEDNNGVEDLTEVNFCEIDEKFFANLRDALKLTIPPPSGSVLWYWRADNGSMIPYDSTSNESIEQAYQAGESHVVLRNRVVIFSDDKHKQVNVTTKFTRFVERKLLPQKNNNTNNTNTNTNNSSTSIAFTT